MLAPSRRLRARRQGVVRPVRHRHRAHPVPGFRKNCPGRERPGRGAAAVAERLLPSLCAEARGYSLLLFCSVLATYLFIRLAETLRTTGSGARTSSSGPVGLRPFFRGAGPAGAFLHPPFLPADDGRDRKILAAYFVVGLLVLPIVYFILTKDLGQIDWIRKPTLGHGKGCSGAFRERGGQGVQQGVCTLRRGASRRAARRPPSSGPGGPSRPGGMR